MNDVRCRSGELAAMQKHPLPYLITQNGSGLWYLFIKTKTLGDLQVCATATIVYSSTLKHRAQEMA
jgi:hypothetical protein